MSTNSNVWKFFKFETRKTIFYLKIRHFSFGLKKTRSNLGELFGKLKEKSVQLKSNFPKISSKQLDDFENSTNQRFSRFDEEIEVLTSNEEKVQGENRRLNDELENLKKNVERFREKFLVEANFFSKIENLESLTEFERKFRRTKSEFDENLTNKLENLTTDVQKFSSANKREESTILSTKLMSVVTRHRTLLQEIERFAERVDERIQNETNGVVETYRKFLDNLRVKLTRIRDDSRLTIEGKIKIVQEISHALGSGNVYVNQAINSIKTARNAVDEECQNIDDEWTQFNSDFDDQKQEVFQLDERFRQINDLISRSIDEFERNNQLFQSLLVNQSTLNAKTEKLRQLQVCSEIQRKNHLFPLRFFSFRKSSKI